MPTRVKSNGLTGLKKLRQMDVTCVKHEDGHMACSAMWKSRLETRKYRGYSEKEAIKLFIIEVCV